MTYKNIVLAAMIVTVAGTVTVSANALALGEKENRLAVTETQKQQVADKKAEIKARLETAKTQRTEKLATKKLEVCEKRQERINKLLNNATERNTKHLAVFQKIEEKVKAFYVSKNITTEDYDDAVANVDLKEAAAIAAIETSNEVTFDCATTDAAKPGGEVKTVMQARHTALKEYRTAIKDLILVVKKHNGQNRDRSSNATTEADSQTDTETEATGTEQ